MEQLPFLGVLEKNCHAGEGALGKVLNVMKGSVLGVQAATVYAAAVQYRCQVMG
jgi:hypothetical protein